AVSVVDAGRASKLDPQEVLARAPAPEKESFGRLNRTHVDVQSPVSIGVERHDGAPVRLEIETLEKGAFLEQRILRRAARVAAAVCEEGVSLDSRDARSLTIESFLAAHVVVPVSQRLPPELELSVVLAPVTPHSVGRIDVGPGVVVEIRRHGAPVPTGAAR